MISLKDKVKLTIESVKDKFDVLVLKGFSNELLLEIEKSYPHPIGLPLNTNSKLDLDLISGSFTKLLIGVSGAQSKQMMDFESFFQLGKNVNLDELGKRFLILENNLLSEYPNQSNETSEDYEDLLHEGKEIPEGNFTNFYAKATSFGEIVLIQYIDGLFDEFACLERVELFSPENPLFTRIQADDDLTIDYKFYFEPISKSYLDFKLDLFYGKYISPVKIGVDDNIKRQPDAYLELKIFASAISNLGLPVELIVQDGRLRSDYRPELNDLLQKHWDSPTFRDLEIYNDPDVSTELIRISQAAVVEEVIQQFENGNIHQKSVRDIFLTAPTGAGKSLLFQLPAIYLAEKYNAVTVVISPLIALMKDQVIALRKDRQFDGVAYINSELSLIEREDIIDQVHNGDISILYLSPELLLSYELSMFIGDRSLGLLVIDEAHLVTTWGRDFRVDYWYLGNYIKKIRKYYDKYKFPVMAVTATAVYSGPNDMAFETLDSLAMENAIMYIGKVRRDNINFDINEIIIDQSHESEKINKTAGFIADQIGKKQKTIVYCPWTNQLSTIRSIVPARLQNQVGIYHGGLNKELKNETYERFKNGSISAIVSTKAFGMGVDIDDIDVVYHHAPSGHLADYVQEVGRLARKPGSTGVAAIDFNQRDLKYTKILYGLSSIKQYQVKMVLEKLNKIYVLRGKKRNLLVSVDDFSHVFSGDNVDIDQKVKSSLLLLEKDLLQRYRYPVMLARPKSLFTVVYGRVNKEDETKILSKFGEFFTHEPNKLVESKDQKIFRIDLGALWEKHFSDESFPIIKYKYFSKTLFEKLGVSVSPQLKLTYQLNQSSKNTFELLTLRFQAINNALADVQGKYFTKKDLTKALNKYVSDASLAANIAELVLTVYTETKVSGRSKRSFIQQRRAGEEYQYAVISQAFTAVRSDVRSRYERRLGTLPEDFRYSTSFLPVNDERNVGLLQLAYVLEGMDLGSYELAGGENPSVFIRLNDPVKLKRLADRGYNNAILKEVDRRQKMSVEIMEYFFTHKLSNEQRWDFIESYFLGKPVEELMGKEPEIEDNED
jgi:ATP-dependent DNA helicase RecQ